ncbi:hypothetical protein [Gimesia aquarii]|uniref:Glycosyltransferase RgtA/B/C/D-like domain-containing protein n=1 Tax=Gimesia aquarii TaxID=2527964 RepID=A0A517WY94_9PLAN|nr:hypothetical protein [Gimesia aquarii]QDU10220.1 hypothetical protein V202x_36190 [Gimesia aquarii]
MKTTLILLTCYVLAALLLLTRVVPNQFVRFKILNRFRKVFQTFSSPVTSVITVFLLSFLLSAGISSFKKPIPRIHDEFSYLLAADTISQGRLTNPTHPFWKHFESFHIIHQPTYASKYPVGQGLFLALGQVLTGHPIVGAWLSVALACAAICWMLHAWVPPRWAFAGGLLSALHPIILLWGQNYWGGAVAMLGGALLFGALRRLIKHPYSGTALILGTGLLILSVSRPFEGFLTAVSAAVILMIWMIKQTEFSKMVLVRSILFPLGFTSLCIVGIIAFYNDQVTGSSFRFPYQVHEETYSQTPLFLWGTPRDANVANPHLRKFQSEWSYEMYQRQQELSGYWDTVSIKISRLLGNLIVFPLGVFLLIIPWIIKERWGCIAVTIVLLISFIDLFGATFFQPHYLAPVIPLVFFILIQGARQWRVAWWQDRNQGPVLVFGLGLIFVAMSFTKIWLFTSTPELPAQYPIALQRSELIEQLKQNQKKDLVFVKYSDDHDPHFEWIYNRANIDDAEVVWAHVLDEESNKKLREYFSDRQVWIINADDKQVKLKAFLQNSLDTKPNETRPKDSGSSTFETTPNQR